MSPRFDAEASPTSARSEDVCLYDIKAPFNAKVSVQTIDDLVAIEAKKSEKVFRKKIEKFTKLFSSFSYQMYL